MSEKPKPIDILGDILNCTHSGAIRGMDELTKLTHVVHNEPLWRTPARQPSRQSKKPAEGGKKRKTTHYLTPEVFGNLGDAKEDIKDFLPEEVKSQATKSSIIESAITVVLQEFEEKGKESALIQELLKKKKK